MDGIHGSKQTVRRRIAYRLAQGPEEKFGHAGLIAGLVLMRRRAAGLKAVRMLSKVTW